MTRRPAHHEAKAPVANGGDRPRRQRLEWLLRGALVVLVLAVFGQTIRFGFVRLDDPGYVSENPHVLGGPAATNLGWAFTTFHRSNWHPLTWVSLQFDAAMGGGSPAVFHATNLVLHAAAALLLFQFLLEFAGGAWRSAWVAALFAVHPLHVESVAWITERKDLLSTVFFFLALLAYGSWARKRSAIRYAASLLAAAAGFLAKPTLVSIPVVLLILDFWPLGRIPAKGSLRRAIVEKVPFAVLALGSAAITVVAQSRGGAVGSLETFPLGSRLANAAVSCVHYLFKTVWPAGLALPYPYDVATLTIPRVFGAVAILAAITVVSVRARRTSPHLLAGWTWYLVTLTPVLGIVQVGTQAMADRYTYVPLVGIFIAVAWSLPDLSTRPWRVVPSGWTAALAPLTIVALAVIAWMQTSLWRSSTELFSHAIRVAPVNAVALDVLGLEALDAGHTDEAVRLFRAALAASTRYADGHSHLATALVRSGKHREAMEHYVEATRIRPSDSDAHTNLGILLDQMGRAGEAEAQFRDALRLNPTSTLARSGFGLLLARGGRDAEAITPLAGVVRDAPSDVPARINLAAVLSRLGRLDDARSHLEAALRLDPRNVLVNVNLGALYAEQGRTAEAEARFVEALRRDPENAVARAYLERLRTR